MDRAMDPVTVNIVTQLNRRHVAEMEAVQSKHHRSEFAARVTKACLIMRECGPEPDEEHTAFGKVVELLEDYLQDFDAMADFTELAAGHMREQDIAQIKHYVTLPWLHKNEGHCLCRICSVFVRTR